MMCHAVRYRSVARHAVRYRSVACYAVACHAVQCRSLAKHAAVACRATQHYALPYRRVRVGIGNWFPHHTAPLGSATIPQVNFTRDSHT